MSSLNAGHHEVDKPCSNNVSEEEIVLSKARYARLIYSCTMSDSSRNKRQFKLKAQRQWPGCLQNDYSYDGVEGPIKSEYSNLGEFEMVSVKLVVLCKALVQCLVQVNIRNNDLQMEVIFKVLLLTINVKIYLPITGNMMGYMNDQLMVVNGKHWATIEKSTDFFKFEAITTSRQMLIFVKDKDLYPLLNRSRICEFVTITFEELGESLLSTFVNCFEAIIGIIYIAITTENKEFSIQQIETEPIQQSRNSNEFQSVVINKRLNNFSMGNTFALLGHDSSANLSIVLDYGLYLVDFKTRFVSCNLLTWKILKNFHKKTFAFASRGALLSQPKQRTCKKWSNLILVKSMSLPYKFTYTFGTLPSTKTPAELLFYETFSLLLTNVGLYAWIKAECMDQRCKVLICWMDCYLTQIVLLGIRSLVALNGCLLRGSIACLKIFVKRAVLVTESFSVLQSCGGDERYSKTFQLENELKLESQPIVFVLFFRRSINFSDGYYFLGIKLNSIQYLLNVVLGSGNSEKQGKGLYFILPQTDNEFIADQIKYVMLDQNNKEVVVNENYHNKSSRWYMVIVFKWYFRYISQTPQGLANAMALEVLFSTCKKEASGRRPHATITVENHVSNSLGDAPFDNRNEPMITLLRVNRRCCRKPIGGHVKLLLSWTKYLNNDSKSITMHDHSRILDITSMGESVRQNPKEAWSRNYRIESTRTGRRKSKTL